MVIFAGLYIGPTLWRLKKGQAKGINFDTLESICCALSCKPGDALTIASKTSGK